MPGTFLLTSDGLSSRPIIEALVLAVGSARGAVAIVTTASRGKAFNPYSRAARAQYLDLGFSPIDFVDLETDPSFNFSPYQVIHVCGGNTFKLLHFSRLANFKFSIENLIARGGVYVGVCAGTNLVTPSSLFVSEMNLDPNKIGLTDFSAFNLVSFDIFVHYSPPYDPPLRAFEQKHNVSFIRINNDQAVVVKDGKNWIV